MTIEHLLDVSDLEPPEPMVKVLAEMDTLSAGEYVRMLHRMEPVPLYSVLRRDDFRYHTRFGKVAAFEVFIWRKGDARADQAVQAVLNRE